MDYKSTVVKKPWGYEYLAYENEHVALWFLSISKNQRTSMHCHPSKTTGLMVVNGCAEVSFLSDKVLLNSSEKVMIRKGLFHSTRALKDDLKIFEIETPVDKHDLVRLEDNYGRTGQPYEDASKEMPKSEDCVWIEDPVEGEYKTYKFADQQISVYCISSFREIELLNLSSESGLMFLKGGISTDYGVQVAGPGDIVSKDVLHKLLQVFKNISSGTVILKHCGDGANEGLSTRI